MIAVEEPFFIALRHQPNGRPAASMAVSASLTWHRSNRLSTSSISIRWRWPRNRKSTASPRTLDSRPSTAKNYATAVKRSPAERIAGREFWASQRSLAWLRMKTSASGSGAPQEIGGGAKSSLSS